MPARYDAIVIGTGQSGPALAARLGQAGQRTAIIERQRVGGTCVNVGCTPTKTLVGSARVAHAARTAAAFGIRIEGAVQVDMRAVKARKDRLVNASSKGVTDWMQGSENVTLVRGHARFTGARRIEVNGETLEAERVFINVGGRARIPDLPGLDAVEYLTSSSILDLDEVPRHLLIVGGSYIGLEFAQIYRRFGAEVTVVEMGEHLIGREDPEISDAVREILEGEGVRVRLGAECLSVSRAGAGIRLALECGDAPPAVDGSHLLLATGRVPNTDDLGLEHAGVRTDQRGYIEVDDQLRTSAKGVWALGDANGRGAFTHTSYHDHEVVAANLLDDGSRRVSERIPCYGLFIDPPLGRVGMTEREVRESGRRARVARLPMQRVARAREFGETRGLMKVMVDADSDRILGAAILGLSGDEVVHCLSEVMYADAPYTTISRAVHIHPTVTELLPTLFGNLEALD